MALLLFKSAVAQNLAMQSSVVADKVKAWIRSVQELIFDKNKNKKGKAINPVANHIKTVE